MEQPHHSVGHVPVISLVPQVGQVATGTWKVAKNRLGEIIVAGCRGDALIGAPELGQSVDQNGLQPVPKPAMAGVQKIKPLPFLDIGALRAQMNKQVWWRVKQRCIFPREG